MRLLQLTSGKTASGTATQIPRWGVSYDAFFAELKAVAEGDKRLAQDIGGYDAVNPCGDHWVDNKAIETHFVQQTTQRRCTRQRNEDALDTQHVASDALEHIHQPLQQS